MLTQPYSPSANLFPAVDGAKQHGEILMTRPGLRIARLIIPMTAPMTVLQTPDALAIVVVRGTGLVDIAGTQRRVRAGEVLDIAAGTQYSVSAHDELELIFVHTP